MSGDVRDRRLFDHDPLTGMTEYFHFDEETGGFTMETVQDVEPHIEVAKWCYNNAPLRWGEMTLVKHIPQIFMMKLAQDGIITYGGKILDHKRFRAFLNERDTNYFKTRPGNV